MSLSLSGINRSRYAEPAAAVCCAVLAALALWLLVRLVWSLVPRDVADSAPLRADGAITGAGPATSIARWHLFGNSPVRAGAGPGSPVTTLSLILRGTLAESDPKAGIALIADPQNGERALRVGQDAAPGARLSAVYPDHIVLLHEGAEEILKLPRDTNLEPTNVVRSAPATAGRKGLVQSGGAQSVGPGAAPAAASSAATTTANLKAPADWQQTVTRLRQNPDELAKRVQIVPVLDGGKLTGVRVAAGADAALINQIGLRAGDVITSVNGLPIDSVARGQEIMSSLSQASSVHVTVLRDGKPTDVTVSLQ